MEHEEILATAEFTFGGKMTEGTPDFIDNGPIINFSDLDSVPDNVQPLIPASRNVKLRIADAKVPDPDKKGRRKIDINWVVVDGVLVDGDLKYKNARFWQRGNFFDNIYFDANPNYNITDYWTTGKYKQNLKSLMKAVSIAQIDPNDLRSSLVGKELIGTIVQEPHQTYNEDLQEYVDDGTFTNCVRSFKPLM